MRVAVGLFGLTLGDRNARARGQRQRQVPAARRRDGFVGPASGRGQIPARQRSLGHVSNPDCRHLGLDTEVVASPPRSHRPPRQRRPRRGSRQSTPRRRGPGRTRQVSAAASTAELAASRAALRSPWYASMRACMNRAQHHHEHVVSRVGLGNHLTQLRDGSNRITGHPLSLSPRPSGTHAKRTGHPWRRRGRVLLRRPRAPPIGSPSKTATNA